ncbi:hypothetical protein HK414_11985 [Ramlibacter terrae]|uniref:Response regulator n=1 Tax=Ramlibacter terrae TaxID=2732511 RepID=A0ABX6P4H7_9BURK|nr:hypothetical protein HK414_11985 [Ramlibacter terrae]
MPSPAKLPVADDLAALEALRRALMAPFDLQPATTVQDAQRKLDETPDVVVCGCHFDDGGMYDLLRFMKATPRLAGIPFVAVRCLEGELDDTLYESVKIAVRALGGDAFVDLLRWQRKYGEAEAAHRLTDLVTRLAQSPAPDTA